MDIRRIAFGIESVTSACWWRSLAVAVIWFLSGNLGSFGREHRGEEGGGELEYYWVSFAGSLSISLELYLIRCYLHNSSNFPLTTCTMTNLLSLDDHFLFFSSMLLAGKVKWKRSSKSMLTFSRVLSSFLLAPLFPFPSSPLLTVLLRTFLVAIPQCRFVQCVNKLCSCGLQ
uniref:(northern house mosquito) hypothetical protein n=1 Tax=Culex pipiens TaxID=7175 RepID=A0A8D8IQ85_CULPI